MRIHSKSANLGNEIVSRLGNGPCQDESSDNVRHRMSFSCVDNASSIGFNVVRANWIIPCANALAADLYRIWHIDGTFISQCSWMVKWHSNTWFGLFLIKKTEKSSFLGNKMEISIVFILANINWYSQFLYDRVENFANKYGQMIIYVKSLLRSVFIEQDTVTVRVERPYQWWCIACLSLLNM